MHVSFFGGQTAYNAQLVRGLSLVLRSAGRRGFLAGGRDRPLILAESPWLLHCSHSKRWPAHRRLFLSPSLIARSKPDRLLACMCVDLKMLTPRLFLPHLFPACHSGTIGLYDRIPVVILDFASLYPSIFRAYNLCYSTLLHPDDAAALPRDEVYISPCGASFVLPTIRRGVLPAILEALTRARAAVREQLHHVEDPAMRAVLDSRQKALKITANALYGFTGAQASPLQCAPLADSCLAIGARSCVRAKEVLEAAATDGRLGFAGAGAKIIYGHTDSLFVELPAAPSIPAAIAAGRAAADIVSAAFPDPMEIKFERACKPLLLLHVNRYAGRAFTSAEDPGGGELIVKGEGRSDST
jgi:DNA polymerase delta subunit 1